MEIRNRETDVEFLEEKVRELQRQNPDIRTRLFQEPQDNHDEIKERLTRIEDKVDVLTRKIELIFGNSFLKDGQFQSLDYK